VGDDACIAIAWFRTNQRSRFVCEVYRARDPASETPAQLLSLPSLSDPNSSSDKSEKGERGERAVGGETKLTGDGEERYERSPGGEGERSGCRATLTGEERLDEPTPGEAGRD